MGYYTTWSWYTATHEHSSPRPAPWFGPVLHAAPHRLPHAQRLSGSARGTDRAGRRAGGADGQLRVAPRALAAAAGGVLLPDGAHQPDRALRLRRGARAAAVAAGDGV